MHEFEVTFRYKVSEATAQEGYNTTDPEEMAQIDLESLQAGEMDISDLVDEDAINSLKIRPV